MAVITGTPSSDNIFGTDSEDQITALQGDDTVFGLAGNDNIQGNAGNDALFGNAGDDIIHGGFSDDLIYGGKGNDTLFGDKGDDTLIGNRGADYLQGGEGRDTFVIGAGSGGNSFQDADIISDFSNGEDIIGLTGGIAFKDLNIFQGTADNIGNTIIQNNSTGEYLAILQGVNRGDIGSGNFATYAPTTNTALPTVTISATDASASEAAGDTGTFTVTRSNTTGNLTVSYAISGTALNGTDYNNIASAVTIPDGQTSATITITPTIDNIQPEPDETVVLGITPSAAYNVGSPSSSQVVIHDPGAGSGSGISTVPTAGGDLLTGTSAADNIDGLAGNDTINGLGGDDTLFGNDGNDLLRGGDGNDSLSGGNGDDFITGGPGNDILTGGAGADKFIYTAPTEGVDTIADFTPADDSILISASGFSGGLVAGTLPGTAFELGVAATAATTRFVYDAATGALFFDVDGLGGTAAVQIATLTGMPALAAGNITVF